MHSVLYQDPHIRIPLKGVMAHPWVTCGGSTALRTVWRISSPCCTLALVAAASLNTCDLLPTMTRYQGISAMC
jgi:hypothetical protein